RSASATWASASFASPPLSETGFISGRKCMKRTFISLVAILAIVPVAAIAHHSFAAEYDSGKAMTLVGAINKVDQQNPHGFFYMNVMGANGRVTNWALETPGPNQLVRNGFTQEMYEK